MGTKEKGISCYEKAGPQEELFVLRAQDFSSAEVIIEWIKMNFRKTPDAKLREAFECALRMKAFNENVFWKNAD
jgi:hypothetical protein